MRKHRSSLEATTLRELAEYSLKSGRHKQDCIVHCSTKVIPNGEPPRWLQKARSSPARIVSGSQIHEVAAQHSVSSTVGLGDADKLKCGLLVKASLAQRCTGAASKRAGCRDDRKQICSVID